MKHSTKIFFRNALIHSLILSGISIVITVIYYLLNFSLFNFAFGIVNIIISCTMAIIIVNLAIKKYRISYLEGNIKYMQCVLIGFIILFISGVINFIFSIIMFHYIDPDYMKQQVDIFLQNMQSYNLPEDRMDAIIESTRNSLDLKHQILTSLFHVPLFAAVISFLISIFVKKQDKSFEPNFR